MKRNHHQAAALPEAVLLQAIPRTEDMTRTAYMPTQPCGTSHALTNRTNRTLLHTPGITLPGATLWRRPGKRTGRRT